MRAPFLYRVGPALLATLAACSSGAASAGPGDAAGEASARTQADAGPLADASAGGDGSSPSPRDASTATVDGPAASPDAASPGATPLSLVLPASLDVDEEKTLTATVGTAGGAGSARIFLESLPPGAYWDEPSRTFAFTPDFTQGGSAATWSVQVTADDGVSRVTGTFTVHVNDTIRPPAPVVTSSSPQNGYVQLTVTQTTDAFLDSPGYAGRTFTAVVSAPTGTSATSTVPVRVGLHGFSGAPATDGWSGEFRIYPYDPSNTYWWGYGDTLPGATPTTGTVPEYTARRVLHLLSWLLATYPGADPERVYLDGVSMGGAGVMTMGLLHARHFAHARGSFGQAIPKNHRPSRMATLTPFWGDPATNLDDGYGMGVWDRMDLTRVVRDVPEARDQFLTIKHSKDDTTIHFGAVVMPSPLTQATFYGALQAQHLGHHAIWDEGGHLIADPVLGDGWWTAGWDPIFDTTALLRLHRAFPAFSGASIDRNPGTGSGNGRQPWSVETGFAGNVTVPGDTGWDGDLAGGLNRFLRWDGTMIVDTLDRFAIPLRVLDGQGGAPPRAGYPTTGDKLDGTPPVAVDVTPRRTQSFRCRPGELVAWTFGTQTGVAVADATASVTVPRLELTTSWTTLTLTRAK